MSPRTYNLGKREAAASETRGRILAAAREILANESATSDLSMEGIARRADVSRLTIYYQFKSRHGLLEALYDELARRGNMHRMGEVFREPEPSLALEKLVRTFIGFWSSDPVVIRRLRGMAALDAEMAAGIQARDARRLHIAREVLGRTTEFTKIKGGVENRNLAASVLSMLTSFETYDALSRAGHSEQEITATVIGLARVAVGFGS